MIRTDSGELRVWAPDNRREQPLAFALPLDDELPIRVKAALRLWARIVHLRSDLGPPPLALTRQRHDRLMLMLRALDGHLADASYRDIADVLFGARRLEHEPWKTSSVRDTTIRLVRGGLALMRAGYRKLLRGRSIPSPNSGSFSTQPPRYTVDPSCGGNSRFSAPRGSDFITSIFTIPLRTRTSPS